jgi:chromate transporter
MHQELVERRRRISKPLPARSTTVWCCRARQQLATYIGWLMHRTWGGIVAGGLFVLPSVFILIALSWVYVSYGNVPLVAGIFYGIKPAVVAIVLAAAWRIAQRALKHPALWVLASAAFVAIFAFDAPFPAIVLAAGIVATSAGASIRAYSPAAAAMAPPNRATAPR